MSSILEGRVVRNKIKEELRAKVRGLSTKPSLRIIRVGDRPDTAAYIRQKKLFGDEVGISVSVADLPADASEEEALAAVRAANDALDIHGIIVQLPLPSQLDAAHIIDAIDPRKDVDGLTAPSIKRLVAGDTSGFIPATAAGVLRLLSYYEIPIAGKRAVIVGRSLLVGKPLGLLLLAHDATVTLCHRRTTALASITKAADIVLIAAGTPIFFGKEYFAPGQVVIDIGINAVPGGKLDEEVGDRRLVGDVKFEEVKDIVAALSPVPGGVGPMTVACLFENVCRAQALQAAAAQ